MTDPTPSFAYEPEDLDGHTLDELNDYLERGRRPFDPSIEHSPACLLALDHLQRLRATTASFLGDGDLQQPGEDWISRVVAAIPLDARSGRSFPVATKDPDLAVSVTEGALRGLVRSVGDEIPGLLVGGVRFAPGAPTALEIDVAMIHGLPLPLAVQRLRTALFEALPAHVPFPIDRIDVRVVSLIRLEGAGR